MTTRVVNIKKEAAEVYIGRPSAFGNPWRIGVDGTREEVIDLYRQSTAANYLDNVSFRNEIRALKGMTLGCFCSPLPCHGDVLAELADAEDPFALAWGWLME
jgi:hypothetical protein